MCFDTITSPCYSVPLTGVLPIQVEEEVVEPLMTQPAPLIPPRGAEVDSDDVPPALPPPLSQNNIVDDGPFRYLNPPAPPSSVL